jgi:YbbR domain-containing protein
VTRYLKWITENFWWKVLALAIAFALWWVVASEPELSVFVTVPLTYKNLPDDLEISAEPVNSISLELRGPSGELRGLGDSGSTRPGVILDMTGVHTGERTFPIGSGNVRLARSVRMIRAIPSEARFEFERRATKQVRVAPRFGGDGANGYSVAHYAVEPDMLQVVGPASRVERISSVITDPVNVAAVVGTARFRVNAFVEDPYVRFADSPQVTVAVTMKKK